MKIKLEAKDQSRQQALYVAGKDWAMSAKYARLLRKRGYYGKPAYLRRGSVATVQQALSDAVHIAYSRAHKDAGLEVPHEFASLVKI